MLFFLSLLITASVAARQSFQRVRDRTRGTTVIRIGVHVDGTAIVALRSALASEFSMDLNAMTTVTKFFGGIFDMVNEDIQNLGVQVRGDFTEVLIENPPYDTSRCIEGDPLITRTSAMKNVLKKPGSEPGNELVLFFCPELVMAPPRNILIANNTCSSVAGTMFGEIRALRDAITDAVYKLVSGGTSRPLGTTREFEHGTKRLATDCIGHEKNVYGEFVRDLKSVRHLSTERFILENASKVSEHDLMDDVYFLEKKPRVLGHPTEDYSNDYELYSDFNK